MGIVLVFLGCFLLYAKSKHVPPYLENIKHKATQNKVWTRIIAYLFFALSICLLSLQFDVTTGIIAFFIALIFSLSLIIILLPLNKKYAYIIASISVIVIIIENMI